MSHKQQQQQSMERREERGEREESMLSRPSETLRGLVSRMERFLEKPWEAFGSLAEPTLDVEQRPKELVVSTRLPGYTKDDVSIDLTEDSITIRGTHSTERGRKHGSFREERTFVRSMTLPASVKTDGAKASFKGDRLEITLPRVKEAQVRRLDVS